jgi:large subunit ribosomal protein L21
MYAVVLTGGKQYKVEEGDLVSFERLAGEVGDSIELPVAFIADGDTIISEASKLSSAKVVAEIVEQGKGKKAIVFKFKKRKGYKRKQGHRQLLTKVKIVEIQKAPGAKKASKAKKAEQDAVEDAVEDAAIEQDAVVEQQDAVVEQQDAAIEQQDVAEAAAEQPSKEESE